MKKIVITGASSGIGFCCANYFLNSGAFVVLVGRDVDELKKIASNFPKNATVITCDLTKDIQIYDLKTSVIETFGHVDILINCAGIKFDSDVEKTFPQDFDYSLDVNLRSVFLLIKSFSKFFTHDSSIVNVSCLYGTRPMQGLISFCMAKAGLEAFTKSAAGEFAADGIRINCVSCCPIYSNSIRYVKGHEVENLSIEEKMKNNVPLGRMAYPTEPAKAIIFLCSKRASGITGQIIKVDGGRNLTSSGYVHYKGYRNMNCRFEPDDENLWKKLDIFGFFNDDKNNNVDTEKMDDKELDEFINKKIKQSNFSTNLNDAHKKIISSYSGITNNDDKLSQKYNENNENNNNI